jgi:hypothetical protein
LKAQCGEQRMSKGPSRIVVASLCVACSVYDNPAGQGGAGGSKATGSAGGESGSAGASGAGSGVTTGGAGESGAGGARETDGGGGSGGAIEDGGPTLNEAAADTNGGSTIEAGDAGVAGTEGSVAMDASWCALSALQFGGAQAYVRVNRPVQDDFTLEAWIKASTPGLMAGMNFWQGSGLLYADAPGDGNDFGVVVLGSKLAFGVGNPNTTIASTSDVTTGAWVHVAATRRKVTGEIQVYVNGTMENSKIVPSVASLSAQPNLTIGGNAIDNRYFTGVMDEVRAWNVVRSQDDIRVTMRKRLTGMEPGLVGYWRFDEGTGIVTTDTSPPPADAGRNNGDLFGPINWVASDAPVCP